jgi:hypothetical protein
LTVTSNSWLVLLEHEVDLRLERGRTPPPGVSELPQIAVVAVARELAGFFWAVIRDLPTPDPPNVP